MPLAGAFTGYLLSNGNAINVNFGAEIAQSVFENNYLTHQQIEEYYKEYDACRKSGNITTCSPELREKYKDLSEANNTKMQASSTAEEWGAHYLAIKAGYEKLQELRERVGREGFYRDFSTFVALEQNYGYQLLGGYNYKLNDTDFATWSGQNCSIADKSCLDSFTTEIANEASAQMGAVATTLITPIGVAVGGYECVAGGGCTDLALSLVPAGAIVSVGGKFFVKAGGKLIAATFKKTDDGLKAVTEKAEEIDVTIHVTNKTADGIWDQGRISPIQRGKIIEDYLANTDYSDWERVGSQSYGFSPAWDFNQGSTWVSLKTLDTTGSGWQSSMRSHIDELEKWSSPTNQNATKVLDIRVQPGGSAETRFLVNYGESRGVLVQINEF